MTATRDDSRTEADRALERLASELGRGDLDTFRAARLPEDLDPVVLLDTPREAGVVASYERPDRAFALVGVGEAGRIDLDRGASPDSARPDIERLLREGRTGTLEGALRPRLLGGFAFDGEREAGDPWRGFGAGSLVLPRVLLVRDGDTRAVVLAPGVPPEELLASVRATARGPGGQREPGFDGEPLRFAHRVDADAYRSGVAAITRDIREGEYDKAVLATSQELSAQHDIDTGQALRRLRERYPECHVFSFHGAGATFLGASPELLVSLREGMVTTLGLAGSAARGATPEEDERLGAALLGSEKDRAEHAIVVRAIRESLLAVTEQLRAPSTPGLRRLRNIQHLATEIAGRVVPGVDILELVRRLHPTPAVCGWPRDAARRVIHALEQFERGWYAGPIGWLDADGEGEFAVALRAALVRWERAWLFAGAGIMGDSDPDSELAEVRLKFRPLADALGGAAL